MEPSFGLEFKLQKRSRKKHLLESPTAERLADTVRVETLPSTYASSLQSAPGVTPQVTMTGRRQQLYPGKPHTRRVDVCIPECIPAVTHEYTYAPSGMCFPRGWDYCFGGVAAGGVAGAGVAPLAAR